MWLPGFSFFLPLWWQESSELVQKHLRASLFAQKAVVQLHLIVWRGELDRIDVLSKEVIKQVLFGLCYFGLAVWRGWVLGSVLQQGD